MQDRIAHICSLLPPADVYADVGCDHGYMAKYALEHGLCERVYVTDIHAGSLKKAEVLLADFIAKGRCVPVLCDGLTGVPERCDFVLIAGMGGEEIVKIFRNAYIPPSFLLQPMKNAEKVRRYLLGEGARLERDYTFAEGTSRRKYYDLMSGTAAGGDEYTEREFRFGRDNLKGASADFLLQMREELEKTKLRRAHALKDKSREALSARCEEIKEILDELERIIPCD